jgi:hypothetical protein
VARPHIEEEPSPFYPPRARWWSGLFYPWFHFLRALHLEQIHCPRGFNVGQTFLSLLVPGISFIALGRRMLGFVVLGIYLASVPVFIVRLGFGEGNFAYGLMLAAHATSVFYLLGHWIGEMEVVNRLLMAVGTLLAVWLLLYFPIVHFFESHYALPLRVRDQVVVMHPRVVPAELKRGDCIMFKMDDDDIGDAHRNGGRVMVRSGIGWGPVLGLPGDQIIFSTNSFAVNGSWQTNLAHMPTSGELLLATNVWFVWPEFGINGHGNASEANISALIMQLSSVSATQMTGRPYQTWFGRKQKLP